MPARPASILSNILIFLMTAVIVCPLVAAGGEAGVKPNIETTQGELRVVLLRVGKCVSVNNQTNFVVTYGVEVPQKGAFSDLHFGSGEEVTLSVGGKPITPTNGYSSLSTGFKDLPRQSEMTEPLTPKGRAMLAEEVVWEGTVVESKTVDLKIQFKWRGDDRVFNFTDVPCSVLGLASKK